MNEQNFLIVNDQCNSFAEPGFMFLLQCLIILKGTTCLLTWTFKGSLQFDMIQRLHVGSY